MIYKKTDGMYCKKGKICGNGIKYKNHITERMLLINDIYRLKENKWIKLTNYFNY